MLSHNVKSINLNHKILQIKINTYVGSGSGERGWSGAYKLEDYGLYVSQWVIGYVSMTQWLHNI